MMSFSFWKILRPWGLIAFGLTLLFFVSCEKSSDLDARMSVMQGDYLLNAGEGTWHCPDGSLSDRLLDAKLEKVGNTWLFEYCLPYNKGNSWTTFRICQPVRWDPLTDSYYFCPLSAEDIPNTLSVEETYNWRYSIYPRQISIVAGNIVLNWTR